jgi:hypothetical protein
VTDPDKPVTVSAIAERQVHTMTDKVRDMQAAEAVARVLFAQIEGDASDAAWQGCQFKPVFREAARTAFEKLNQSFSDDTFS